MRTKYPSDRDRDRSAITASTEAHDLLAEWAALAHRSFATEHDLNYVKSIRRQSLRLDDSADGGPGNTGRAVLKNELLLQPASALWQADAGQVSDTDDWRERRARAAYHRRGSCGRSPRRAAAARGSTGRGDVAAVMFLLEEVDIWRGFRGEPPAFVLRAVETMTSSQSARTMPLKACRRALAAGCRCGTCPRAGEKSARCRAGGVHADISTILASRAEAPVGIPLAPWLLHQAARALSRDDAVEALACVRRAQARDRFGIGPSVAGAAVVLDAALPGTGAAGASLSHSRQLRAGG